MSIHQERLRLRTEFYATFQFEHFRLVEGEGIVLWTSFQRDPPLNLRHAPLLFVENRSIPINWFNDWSKICPSGKSNFAWKIAFYRSSKASFRVYIIHFASQKNLIKPHSYPGRRAIYIITCNARVYNFIPSSRIVTYFHSSPKAWPSVNKNPRTKKKRDQF